MEGSREQSQPVWRAIGLHTSRLQLALEQTGLDFDVPVERVAVSEAPAMVRTLTGLSEQPKPLGNDGEQAVFRNVRDQQCNRGDNKRHHGQPQCGPGQPNGPQRRRQ